MHSAQLWRLLNLLYSRIAPLDMWETTLSPMFAKGPRPCILFGFTRELRFVATRPATISHGQHVQQPLVRILGMQTARIAQDCHRVLVGRSLAASWSSFTVRKSLRRLAGVWSNPS